MKAEGSALLDQLLPAAPRRAATTRRTELCCAWAGDGNDVEGDDDEDAVEDDDDEDDDYEEENDNHYPAREAQLWCAWSALQKSVFQWFFLFADEELTIVYKKEKKNFVNFFNKQKTFEIFQDDKFGSFTLRNASFQIG